MKGQFSANNSFASLKAIFLREVLKTFLVYKSAFTKQKLYLYYKVSIWQGCFCSQGNKPKMVFSYIVLISKFQDQSLLYLYLGLAQFVLASLTCFKDFLHRVSYKGWILEFLFFCFLAISTSNLNHIQKVRSDLNSSCSEDFKTVLTFDI